MLYKEKCVGCGRCKNVDRNDTDFICYHDAREICGEEYSVDEIFEKIICDKRFYETSGGGVTFSGGECMLQSDFLCDILKKCKESGVHTAIDTAGHISWKVFEKILCYTDLFLYDIKAFNNDIHRKYTGVSNELILENLQKLFERGANVCIRIPVISGVNDTVEEMQKIKNFLAPYKPSKIELLPYHGMGEHKYEALGMKNIKFFKEKNKNQFFIKKTDDLNAFYTINHIKGEYGHIIEYSSRCNPQIDIIKISVWVF